MTQLRQSVMRNAINKFAREAAELERSLAKLPILPADDENWNEEVEIKSVALMKLDYIEEMDDYDRDEVVDETDVIEWSSSLGSQPDIHEVYVDSNIQDEKDFLDSEIVVRIVKVVNGVEEVLTDFESDR